MFLFKNKKKRELVSAIVACYKDEQAIPHMYEELITAFEDVGVDGEFIFVNDHSPDNTDKVLLELAQKDKRVVVVNHSRNFGSQAAFTSGMKIAKGDAVILLDGDLQDPPYLIIDFVKKWREGYDVVYGVRTGRDVGWFLGFAYKMFYKIFRGAAYVPMPLNAGDFSLMDRKVVEAINNLPENNRFIRGLRAWVGFKQTGVEYYRPKRRFGKSTNSWLKNIGWARKGIFSFSYAPLELITAMSILVICVTIIGAVVEMVLYLFFIRVSLGLQGIVLLAVLFLGGVQLLALSIIGSYMAHIYDEVKKRPAYIVENIIRKGGKDSGE